VTSLLDSFRAEVERKRALEAQQQSAAEAQARLVAEPPHDPETGELLEDDDELVDYSRPMGDEPTQPPHGERPLRRREAEAWRWATAPDGSRIRVPAPDEPTPPTRKRKPSGGRGPARPFRWVIDESTGERVKRELTPEEVAARDTAKAEAEAKNAEYRREIATLIPVHPDEIPAIGEGLIRGDARTLGGIELLSLERPNGSRLRMTRKHYDGTGLSGARDIHYISAHVVFLKSNTGLLFRTRGVMFEQGELRAVASVLLAEADRLDSEAGDEVDDSRPMGGNEQP
jgi:hypothetical protein